MELLTSPAAERNKQPIAEQLLALLPPSGKVLEIASGSGQHVVHLAALLPDMTWQPSDPGEAELDAITTRSQQSGLDNILPAKRIDVLADAWPVAADFDAVLCINMIHISPPETTPALFAGAARHLRADGPGLVVLYGPYREGGIHTAPSNAEFESWLKSRDPRFGVRNLEDVEAIAATFGFHRQHLARLPANNLLLAFAHSSEATA